jgi:hypothetical protein
LVFGENAETVGGLFRASVRDAGNGGDAGDATAGDFRLDDGSHCTRTRARHPLNDNLLAALRLLYGADRR